MDISVNFGLAIALVLIAVAVIAFGRWLRERVARYDLLRVVSIALALLLVPVNVVFAFTGSLGVFNAVVMTISIVAIALQAGLFYHWREEAPTPPEVDAVAEPYPETGSGLRILAIGTDAPSLDVAGLEVFTNTGAEVFALILGDRNRRTVAAAERTIIVGLPEVSLHELEADMADSIAEHVAQLSPNLVLAPAADTPAAEALRRALAGVDRYAPVYLYPADMDALSSPTELHDTTSWAFRPPGDEGAPGTERLIMPSFIDR